MTILITLIAYLAISSFSNIHVTSFQLRGTTKISLHSSLTFSPNRQSLCPLYAANKDSRGKDLQGTVVNKKEEVDSEGEKEQTAFDKVASFGLAGILAIATAEAIFWALGVPLAAIYYKVTTGEWIDMMTTDGQLKAAGFSFGYGGFATVILQYRVTLFAIPLVPVMEKLIVTPGKKLLGESFGEAKGGNDKKK